MGGGGVVEMVEMYLQNKYTKTQRLRAVVSCVFMIDSDYQYSDLHIYRLSCQRHMTIVQ